MATGNEYHHIHSYYCIIVLAVRKIVTSITGKEDLSQLIIHGVHGIRMSVPTDQPKVMCNGHSSDACLHLVLTE
jgi:hypothetical protein